jgi:hypothetical protein
MTSGFPAPTISAVQNDYKYTGQVNLWCNLNEQPLFGVRVRQKEYRNLHFLRGDADG